MAPAALAYRVESSPYATDDVIVVAKSAADLGLDNTGASDTTAGIQQLMDDVQAMGGGVAFLEPGIYRIEGRLYLRSGVYLRGVWQRPVLGDPLAASSTILAIVERPGVDSDAATIVYTDFSGVQDMTIWHPDQSSTSPVPYPPAIGRPLERTGAVSSANFTNLTLVNPYRGISARAPEGASAHFNLRNIFGSPLFRGVESDRLSGNSKWTGIFFHPDYWRFSGLAGAPPDGTMADWIKANGHAFEFATSGQLYIQFAEVSGYRRGVFMPSGGSDISLYEVHLRDCDVGFEGLDYNLRAVRSTFEGDTYGYLWNFESNSKGESIFHSCSFSGGEAAVFLPESQSQIFHTCTFHDKVRVEEAEVLSIINSEFPFAGPHVEAAGSKVDAVLLMGNTFQGGLDLSDSSEACVKIDSTRRTYEPLPSLTYSEFEARKPDTLPGTSQLFNVLDFGAAGDGVTDDTAKFQATLDAAAIAGGGIAFVPPGRQYLIAGSLSVPSEVELRGSYEDSHFPSGDPYGSLLLVTGGAGDPEGTATLTMAAGSGLRGLSFYWPNQQLPDAIEYPFLVRATGPGVYAFDLSTANPWQVFDFATFASDNFYVEALYSNTLRTAYRVGGGTSGGNIILNQGKAFWKNVPDEVDPAVPDNSEINFFTLENQIKNVIGDTRDLLLLGNFTRESHIYLQAVSEGDGGPRDVMTINNGGEGTRVAYEINALEGPLSVVNSQYKVNRATPDNPDKAQIVLDYTGRSTVTVFASVMDSKADMEAYLYDGQLEIQALRLDQQTARSGFVVADGARLFASGMNSQETMPISGSGVVDILGSKFRSSFGDSNDARSLEVWRDNEVNRFGRSAIVATYDDINPAGINLADTSDSETVVFVSPDLTDDDDKELVFELRQAVLVDGESVEKLYLDVTNAALTDSPGIEMELALTYHGSGSGLVRVFYDAEGGEQLLESFPIATGNALQEWESVKFSDARFADGLNGADIRIEIDPAADFSLAAAQVMESETHCDDLPLGGTFSPFVQYGLRVPKKIGGISNALPSSWVVTLDDQRVTGTDDPENFVVRDARGLVLSSAGGGDYLQYPIALGRESVADPSSSGFARPAKHVRRTFELWNELGDIEVFTKGAAALMVPSAMDESAAPSPPDDATHFLCYRVNATGSVTGQTPDRGNGKGRFRRDLQVFLQDEFDDCALLEDGLTPSFAASDVEGRCLYDIRKPSQLCNPVDMSAVEPPRETSATMDASEAADVPSLLCYTAKLAARAMSSAAVSQAGMQFGERISPRQSKHQKRRSAEGTQLRLAPGSQFPAPAEADSVTARTICLPTDVLSVAEYP